MSRGNDSKSLLTVGEGKFIHLWQYKDGAWKITRVISYDHHAMASEANRLILQRPGSSDKCRRSQFHQQFSGGVMRFRQLWKSVRMSAYSVQSCPAQERGGPEVIREGSARNPYADNRCICPRLATLQTGGLLFVRRSEGFRSQSDDLSYHYRLGCESIQQVR